jgi:hypothetical protein
MRDSNDNDDDRVSPERYAATLLAAVNHYNNHRADHHDADDCDFCTAFLAVARVTIDAASQLDLPPARA